MRNRQLVHRGMTLVELLVVVAIMVLLLAVSVPMFKPLLEYQKTSNAARVLERAFQQARAKAIYEQQSYGVRLVPFVNAPVASIELRIQKTTFVNFVNPSHIRVKVKNGVIHPYYFYNGKWEPTTWDAANLPAAPGVDLNFQLKVAREHFEYSANIRFNRIGRSFRFLASNNAPALLFPYNELDLPEKENVDYNDAAEYHVFGPAEVVLDWIPPIVMPHGTIVDLAFSGGEVLHFGNDDKMPGDIPSSFPMVQELIVEFSPAGHVNFLYVDGQPYPVNEMLYFCVGEWDRQVDTAGNSLAEDRKSNLEVPATYWVTLHPKMGGTRITQNAPVRSVVPLERLQEARKFASEHFFNVGEN